MKSIHGLVLGLALFATTFFFMAAWSLGHMADLYDRIHYLESLQSTCNCRLD